MRKVLIWVLIHFCSIVNAAPGAGSAPQPSSVPSLSSQIYQQRFEEVKAELAACRQTVATCQQPKTSAEAAYTQRYYVQEAEMRDVELAIYRWQITAANVVLGLMSLLTVAAICFCGYQLWRSQRLSKVPPAQIEIEVSVSKLKMQTSLVGIAVLVAAYGFLLVFTREVYQLRVIERAPVAGAAAAPTLPASGASTRTPR